MELSVTFIVVGLIHLVVQVVDDTIPSPPRVVRLQWALFGVMNVVVGVRGLLTQGTAFHAGFSAASWASIAAFFGVLAFRAVKQRRSGQIT